MKYIIDEMGFRSKAEIIKFVQSIIGRYVSGRSLEPEDQQFITELLMNHPDYKKKIGVGIERIEVRNNYPKFKGFWIIRKNGTQEDFSFYKCLFGGSHKFEVKHTAREEVKHCILKFKQEYFDDCISAKCPITGEYISFGTSHVHHDSISFNELFSEFFGERNIDSIKLIDNGGSCKLFADRELAKEWIEFHNSKAKLLVVSIVANLSILEVGRKGYAKYRSGGIQATGT